MDESDFDTLTRYLSPFIPRRRTLPILAGALATPLLADPHAASAGCKKVGRKCDKNKDCCSGSKCKGGKHGKCQCKSGREDCDGDGQCENLNTDASNCGACGVVCVSPDACCDGVCSTICVV
jgi:hypothetical protein